MKKAQLYFEKSAKEVLFCDVQGEMTFKNLGGPVKQSVLAPEIPKHFEW